MPNRGTGGRRGLVAVSFFSTRGRRGPVQTHTSVSTGSLDATQINARLNAPVQNLDVASVKKKFLHWKIKQGAKDPTFCKIILGIVSSWFNTLMNSEDNEQGVVHFTRVHNFLQMSEEMQKDIWQMNLFKNKKKGYNPLADGEDAPTGSPAPPVVEIDNHNLDIHNEDVDIDFDDFAMHLEDVAVHNEAVEMNNQNVAFGNTVVTAPLVDAMDTAAPNCQASHFASEIREPTVFGVITAAVGVEIEPNVRSASIEPLANRAAIQIPPTYSEEELVLMQQLWQQYLQQRGPGASLPPSHVIDEMLHLAVVDHRRRQYYRQHRHQLEVEEEDEPQPIGGRQQGGDRGLVQIGAQPPQLDQDDDFMDVGDIFRPERAIAQREFHEYDSEDNEPICQLAPIGDRPIVSPAAGRDEAPDHVLTVRGDIELDDNGIHTQGPHLSSMGIDSAPIANEVPSVDDEQNRSSFSSSLIGLRHKIYNEALSAATPDMREQTEAYNLQFEQNDASDHEQKSGAPLYVPNTMESFAGNDECDQEDQDSGQEDEYEEITEEDQVEADNSQFNTETTIVENQEAADEVMVKEDKSKGAIPKSVISVCRKNSAVPTESSEDSDVVFIRFAHGKSSTNMVPRNGRQDSNASRGQYERQNVRSRFPLLLENHGMSCFINAAMNMIHAIPSMRKGLANAPEKSDLMKYVANILRGHHAYIPILRQLIMSKGVGNAQTFLIFILGELYKFDKRLDCWSSIQFSYGGYCLNCRKQIPAREELMVELGMYGMNGSLELQELFNSYISQLFIRCPDCKKRMRRSYKAPRDHLIVNINGQNRTLTINNFDPNAYFSFFCNAWEPVAFVGFQYNENPNGVNHYLSYLKLDNRRWQCINDDKVYDIEVFSKIQMETIVFKRITLPNRFY